MTMFLDLLAQALYFALPMFVANMAPMFVRRIPFGSSPIDGGRVWRGKPILGAHKTWRGLIAGTASAVAVVYVQRLLPVYGFIDYTASDIWLLGVCLGFGAILGDAIKSFFKRRVGKQPGSAWPPFDQIDFVVGALVLARLYTPIPWQVAGVLLVLTPIGHLAVNRLAYAIGFKDVPY